MTLFKRYNYALSNLNHTNVRTVLYGPCSHRKHCMKVPEAYVFFRHSGGVCFRSNRTTRKLHPLVVLRKLHFGSERRKAKEGTLVFQ